MNPGISRWKMVSLYLSSLASLHNPRQFVRKRGLRGDTHLRKL